MKQKEIEIGNVKFVFTIGHKGFENKDIFLKLKYKVEGPFDCINIAYGFSILGLSIILIVFDIPE